MLCLRRDEESSALISKSGTLQEGVPPQIHRRVTLVRSDEVIREADDVSMAEQLSGSSSAKKKKPKAPKPAEPAAAAAELSLDDIIVKQVSS